MSGGRPLAQNEQQAYERWLHAVRACQQAEIAYGSKIVLRIRYSDLIDHPELPSVGAGEAATSPIPGAIANAVFDAIGVRLRDVPLSV